MILTGPSKPDAGSGGFRVGLLPPNVGGVNANIFLSAGAWASPAMRFVHSLVTFTTMVFLPTFNLLPKSVTYGAFHKVSGWLPFTVTTAMSPTLPRSIFILPFIVPGLTSNILVYVAVPEKYLIPASAFFVHESKAVTDC